MIESNKLHDATLLSMHFDWKARRFRCEFRPVSSSFEELCLLFDGVRDVHIPSLHPWGRSNSVNSVSQSKRDDMVEFKMEMQSGDVIRVLADRIDVEAT